ncbi:MAG: pyruvate dehydrogenase (acetyl-transferring), homodimeric type, partial [Candidatus Acidiferrales bacterium]
MVTRADVRPAEIDELEEVWEWIESFDAVVDSGKPGLAERILREIRERAAERGVSVPFSANTPYVNTINQSDQAPFPGDQELERKVKSLVRWNALAMVVRANRLEHNIGGHLSTYGSIATLFEVGFNHFFRG